MVALADAEGQQGQGAGGFGGSDLPKTSQNPFLCAADVSAALAAAGITLFERGGKLRARPASALTQELRAGIAAHHEALLQEALSVRAREGARAREGTENTQNTQNSDVSGWEDLEWVKEHQKRVYELLKEALEMGCLATAQSVGGDVVDAVEQSAKEAGDVARTCRLLSRDGVGNDVVAAALLAAHEQLCAGLARLGTDPFRRRAAVVLMLARAAAGSAEPMVQPDGALRRAAESVPTQQCLAI